LQRRVAQVEPVGLAGDALAAEQVHDDVQRLVHHAALIGGVDADLDCVVHQRSGPDAQHRPPAGLVIQLHHAVCDNEWVMVRQRDDAGAEADVPGPFRRRRDEHFRTADDLEPAGVVLADPGFVVVQRVQVLQQLHVALQRQDGVFRQVVERCQEDAAAQVGHRGLRFRR